MSMEPHRQSRRTLRPIGRMVPGHDAGALLLTVWSRVQTTRRATGGGSWLLADEDGQLYVLREVSISTDVVLDEHVDWIVGLYCADHANGSTGTVDMGQLRDDLVAHFLASGYVTQRMVRDLVRDEEG